MFSRWVTPTTLPRTAAPSRSWLAVAGALAVAGCAAGAGGEMARAPESRAPSSDAEAVLASERARARALVAQDAAALDTLLAEDLSYTHTTALREGKAATIARVRSGRIRYDSLVTYGQDVRSLGSATVVIGDARAQVAAPPAPPARLTLRYTSIYRRRARGRGWELVVWQSTRVPDGAPAGAR